MFKFSKRSHDILVAVDPRLRRVAEQAIKLSTVDFVVTEGVRTLARQQKLYAAGATQTMNSKHLTGHAIDVAAIVARTVRWDWPLYPTIAEAFRKAAINENVLIRWGGCWEVLNTIHKSVSLDEAVAIYVTERRTAGRKPFIDGPHFELVD